MLLSAVSALHAGRRADAKFLSAHLNIHNCRQFGSFFFSAGLKIHINDSIVIKAAPSVPVFFNSPLTDTSGRTQANHYEFLIADSLGNITDTLAADTLYPLDENLWAYKDSGRFGIYQTLKGKVTRPLFDTLFPSGGRFLMAGLAGLYSPVSYTGALFTGSWYSAYSLKYRFIVLSGPGYCRAFDMAGMQFIPGRYSYIRPVSENRLAAGSPEGEVLLNLAGESQGVFTFDSVSEINHGLFTVTFHEKKGLTDTSGVFVFGPVFDNITALTDSTFLAVNQGQFGILDRSAHEIVPYQQDTLFLRPDGLVIESKKHLLGAYALNGCRLFLPHFNWIGEHSEGYSAALSPSGWDFADDTGAGAKYVHFPRPVQELGKFTSGLAPVKIHGNYGFVDKEGYVRISCRYKQVIPFSEGKAAVSINGNFAVVNRHEKLILQPQFSVTGPYCRGHSIVKRGIHYGLADSLGNTGHNGSAGVEYDSIYSCSLPGFISRKDGKYGLINERGKPVFSPKFNAVRTCFYRRVIVERNRMYGVYDAEGQMLLPVMFTGIEQNPYSGEFILTRFYRP
ncbi:MAG: WG repeat-containing protein [Bacteroidota bacterium]